MRAKYIINLTDEEREYIRAILNSERAAPTFKKRANILLMLDHGAGKPQSQAKIAIRCGVSDMTVYETAKSFCANGLAGTLTFKKREKPSNPTIITAEREARLAALVCGAPPEGFSRWTVRLIAAKAVELGIFPHISRETVRTVLKKLNLNLM